MRQMEFKVAKINQEENYHMKKKKKKPVFFFCKRNKPVSACVIRVYDYNVFF